MKKQTFVLYSVFLSFLAGSGAAYAKALTEDDFNEVIDQIENLYSNSLDEKIKVERYWRPQGERDSAIRFPYITLENPIVKITGLVPQSGFISKDAFALLICHEFGHHLGGSPKLGARKLIQWSTAEGQADYWAASECLKKYIRKDNGEKILGEMNGPLQIQEKCKKNFVTENDIFTCYRGAMAALSLASYFTSLGSKIEIGTHAPATPQLVRAFRIDTFRDQCRIETFLAGSFNEDRPSCWFVDSIPALQE